MGCLCLRTLVALCVCVRASLFVNPVDTRCIKLSWSLVLSWFFLSQHVNKCRVVRICVHGCVQVHTTEGARASLRAIVCVRVHPCACLSVCCVRARYEYLMCCSVFMRLKERSKERGRDREAGEKGVVGDLNHPTTAYGYRGHRAVVLKCDYGHNGEPACLLLQRCKIQATAWPEKFFLFFTSSYQKST